MLKELLHVSLGGMVVLKEKIEEAKSFIDSFTQRGKDEDERIKAKIKEMIKEVVDELGLATKSDIEELKSKLS